MDYKQKLNSAFSIVRVFAVLSIVSVHVGIHEPTWISDIIGAFSSIVTVICLIVLYVGYIIAKSLKLDKLYSTLTGVRMGRNVKEK